MKKIATTSILSLIALLVLATSGVTSTYASVSSYSASDFSQYCSQNSATCSKNEHPGEDSASVTCPQGLVVDKVYVHAGDGQTVYELPDAGFDVSYSNNNTTANVTRTTHPHALSWIAVTCTDGTTPTITVTETPTVTPTPIIECDGEFCQEVTPTVTPTTDPTATPTAGITPGVGGPGGGDGLSDGRSDGKGGAGSGSTLNDPYKGVLGASTMAGTGSFTENLMNLLGVTGAFLLGLGYLSNKRNA
jgi:hypothetical protein